MLLFSKVSTLAYCLYIAALGKVLLRMCALRISCSYFRRRPRCQKLKFPQSLPWQITHAAALRKVLLRMSICVCLVEVLVERKRASPIQYRKRVSQFPVPMCQPPKMEEEEVAGHTSYKCEFARILKDLGVLNCPGAHNWNTGRYF